MLMRMKTCTNNELLHLTESASYCAISHIVLNLYYVRPTLGYKHNMHLVTNERGISLVILVKCTKTRIV